MRKADNQPTVGELRPLPRLLQHGLTVVFIGYNPGIESARLGHYYAHHGNVFWRQLTASGLVSRPVTCLDDRLLADEAGIGFTDLCTRPTPRASELQPAELLHGAAQLKADLESFSPEFAVFSGRGIYTLFGRLALGLSSRDLVHRPDGAQPERIGSTVPFVIPSSSGLASRWHTKRLALLVELRELLQSGADQG